MAKKKFRQTGGCAKNEVITLSPEELFIKNAALQLTVNLNSKTENVEVIELEDSPVPDEDKSNSSITTVTTKQVKETILNTGKPPIKEPITSISAEEKNDNESSEGEPNYQVDSEGEETYEAWKYRYKKYRKRSLLEYQRDDFSSDGDSDKESDPKLQTDGSDVNRANVSHGPTKKKKRNKSPCSSRSKLLPETNVVDYQLSDIPVNNRPYEDDLTGYPLFDHRRRVTPDYEDMVQENDFFYDPLSLYTGEGDFDDRELATLSPFNYNEEMNGIEEQGPSKDFDLDLPYLSHQLAEAFIMTLTKESVNQNNDGGNDSDDNGESSEDSDSDSDSDDYEGDESETENGCGTDAESAEKSNSEAVDGMEFDAEPIEDFRENQAEKQRKDSVDFFTEELIEKHIKYDKGASKKAEPETVEISMEEPEQLILSASGSEVDPEDMIRDREKQRLAELNFDIREAKRLKEQKETRSLRQANAAPGETPVDTETEHSTSPNKVTASRDGRNVEWKQMQSLLKYHLHPEDADPEIEDRPRDIECESTDWAVYQKGLKEFLEKTSPVHRYDPRNDVSCGIEEWKIIQSGISQARERAEKAEKARKRKQAIAEKERREREEEEREKLKRREIPKYTYDLLDPNKNMKSRKQVEVVKNEVRPVIYRMKALSSAKTRLLYAKRTRVTHQVANHKIPQYHLESHENTRFRDVPDKTVAQTLTCYLEASKPFFNQSDRFHDELVATAVEYDRNVKMLHFGTSMKKHSCRQKRVKFQTLWWKRKRTPFKKARSGKLHGPKKPVFRVKEDPILYACHMTLRSTRFSYLQRSLDQLRSRLRVRRNTDDVIMDSTYFVREFFLTKLCVSFRITRSSDIPLAFLPPTLKAGYFPFSVVEKEDQMHYLMCRYREAQKEYFNLSYFDIKPPPEFEVDDIKGEELLNFHNKGRHIHGFFLVWQTTESFYEDEDGNLRGKRYLVDMYFKLKFPLDIKYERWETRLKLAFDRLIIYNLHFSEILRANRPLFNQLVKNPAIFQSLTLDEMLKLMNEQEIDTYYFIHTVGHDQFYDWGKTLADTNYLSAFMIICGGSKILKRNAKSPQRRPANSNPTECSRLTRKQLISFRKKTYKYKDDPPEKKKKPDKPEKPPRKKPGRKPETLQDKGMKRHDFKTRFLASDAESEYEGYLSQSEDVNDNVPTLKRTHSSDTIFMDAAYRDRRFDRVSWMHQEKVDISTESYAKKRKRKMNRIRQKHTLRFFMLESESLAFREMLECYHNNMPRLTIEVSKTKNCIRNPYRFERLKVPRVYGYGDAPFIDVVADILRNCVTHCVALEHASTRAGNGLSYHIQKARTQRREIVRNLPIKKGYNLPKAPYLAMEFLSLAPVISRAWLEEQKRKLFEQLYDLTHPFMNLPPHMQVFKQSMLKIKQADDEFDEFFRDQKERVKQLDRSYRTIVFAPRSLEAQHKKEYERRLARKAHAQKTAARKKMSAEERARAIREEKENEGAVKAAKKQADDRKKLLTSLHMREVDLRERRELTVMARLDRIEKRERRYHNRRKRAAIKKALLARGSQPNDFEWESRKKEVNVEKRENKRAQELEAAMKAAQLKKEQEEEAAKKRLEEEKRNLKKKSGLKKKSDLKKNDVLKKNDEAERERKKKIEKETARIRAEMKKEEEQKQKQQSLKKQAIKRKQDLEIEENMRKLVEKRKIELLKETLEAHRREKEKEEAEAKRLKLEKEKAEEEKRLKLEKEKAEEAERLRHWKMKKPKELQKLKLEREKAEEAERLKLEEERKKKELRKQASKKNVHIVTSPEVDLLTVYKNPLEFEIARSSFRVIDCREVLLEYAELFGLIVMNSLRTPEGELVRYLVNLAEIHPKRPIVTAGCEQLYENIASSFIFKKVENNMMKWIFSYDLDVLLRNIPSDVRTLIEKCRELRITDPELSFSLFSAKTPVATQDSLMRDVFPRFTNVSQDEPELNVSIPDASMLSHIGTVANASVSFVHSKQWSMTPRTSKKTGRVRKLFTSDEPSVGHSNEENGVMVDETAVWIPPDTDEGLFWQLIGVYEDSGKTIEERTRMNEQFLAYLTSKPDLSNNSIHWLFSILGACYVIVVGKKKQDEKLQDVIYEGHQYDEISTDNQVKKVVKNLTTLAWFFQAAHQESQKNLEALIAHNGFQQVFSTLETMIQTIYDLFTALNISTFVRADVSVEDGLLVIFTKIGDECERMIASDYSVPAAVASIMRNDEDDTVNHILEKRPYRPSRLHRDLEHEERINTIIKWYHGVQTHQAEEIKSIKHFALQKAADQYAERIKQLEAIQSQVNTPKPRNKFVKIFDDVDNFEYDGGDESGGSRGNTRANSPDSDILLIEKEPETSYEAIVQDRVSKTPAHLEFLESSEYYVKVESTVRMLSKKICKAQLDLFKKQRALEIEKENMFPTKLPTFEQPFLQHTWRTLARSFYYLSNREKDMMRLFNKYNEIHQQRSFSRIHPLIHDISIAAQNDFLAPELREDPDNWAFYKKLEVGQGLDACRESEQKVLDLFNHIPYTRREFGKMKWEVPRKNGKTIHALEFFTDLEKYRAGKLYRKYATSGFLPFKFYVYDHLWFMGALTPTSYCLDSHEDLGNGVCAGCTEGSVFVIPHCTCEEHLDVKRNTFIYTCFKKGVEAGGVNRILGRFVCEHGPSSFLVLENEQNDNDNQRVVPSKRPTDRPFEPDMNRCIVFDSKLRVIKRKTMYRDLLQAVRTHPKPERRIIRNEPNELASQSDSCDDSSDSDDSEQVFEDSDIEVKEASPDPTSFSDFTFHSNAYETLKKKKTEEQEALRREAERIRNRLEQRRIYKQRHGIRSSSADAPVRESPGTIKYYYCSQSVTDLTQLSKYVEKKMERTRLKLKLEFPEDEDAIPLGDEEILNSHIVFNGTGNASNPQKFQVIASMLECGMKEEIENPKNSTIHMIRAAFEDRGLLKIVGDSIENKPQYDLMGNYLSGKLTSITLNAYYQFLPFINDTYRRARLAPDSLLGTLRTPENKPFKNLLACYEKIFRFNYYLVQHFLEVSLARIFNTSAVYCAEINQDISLIEKNLAKLRHIVPLFLCQLFNTSPIRRQLRDLNEIKDQITEYDLDCHIASLCRYAITRIRVPQTAEKHLNEFSWVNHMAKHQDTFEIFHLNVDETLPRDFNLDKFAILLNQAYYEEYEGESMKHSWESFLAPRRTGGVAVLRAYFNQTESFFEEVERSLPNELVDPKTKAFYEIQFFEKIRQILVTKTHFPTSEDIAKMGPLNAAALISAMIEMPRSNHLSFNLSHSVDAFYEEMLNYEAKLLPVCPSTIGTTFVCFEKDLYFSVVKENEVLVNEKYPSKQLSQDDRHYYVVYNLPESHFNASLNKKDGKLELSYHRDNSYQVDDRFSVAFASHFHVFPYPKWDDISDVKLTGKMNVLRKLLDSLVPTQPNRDDFRVGRLENPVIERKSNRARVIANRSVRFNESVRQYDLQGSDTEGED
uniref:Iwr1 domain-containing protein n=2 Tax=Caenorhabditis tropicalis TaxID=1561998 RepID=A0A1I7T991_9PELO